MKITFVMVAAVAVLTTAPVTTPVKAQGVEAPGRLQQWPGAFCVGRAALKAEGRRLPPQTISRQKYTNSRYRQSDALAGPHEILHID
jgi:hypothetical protein